MRLGDPVALHAGEAGGEIPQVDVPDNLLPPVAEVHVTVASKRAQRLRILPEICQRFRVLQRKLQRLQRVIETFKP